MQFEHKMKKEDLTINYEVIKNKLSIPGRRVLKGKKEYKHVGKK